MKSFVKIFTILTPKQLRMCFLLILFMFVGAVFEAIGIGALYPLINIIGQPDYLIRHKKVYEILSPFGIVSHSLFIIFCSSLLIVFYIIKNLFMLLQTKLQLRFSLNNQKDYTERLYTFYLNKPYLYHVRMNSSILVRNITSGGRIVFADILVSALSIITEVITVVIIWLMLFFMDWTIAIIVACVFGPLIFLILKYFRKRITKQGELQNICVADYMKWLYQGLGSIKETKVMQKESYFNTQFSASYSKYSDSTREFMFIDKIPRVLVELTGVGGILVLVIVKIASGVAPASIVPSLGVLGLAAIRLMPSINRIISLFNTIKFNMPLFNELYSDLIEIKKQKDKDEHKKETKSYVKMPFDHSISIENISFSYPEKKEDVLHNVSFNIQKGDFVGIVGPSGAGKTTFVDILLGLLPPKNGRILVDDKNIYENLSAWLYNIAYVPQSIYLLDGTIQENVALGIPEKEVLKEKVEQVLKMAELFDFVCTLPDKENTRVGEQGAMLSGGQKQRIGIARALYNNPEVLILDEATSALDNETEKSITSTILKLKGSITIISIAHRLSTLENCDFKIRFDNGNALKVTN
jgi:ATP-binding cassette, subfamily B, bacterial PglK